MSNTNKKTTGGAGVPPSAAKLGAAAPHATRARGMGAAPPLRAARVEECTAGAIPEDGEDQDADIGEEEERNSSTPDTMRDTPLQGGAAGEGMGDAARQAAATGAAHGWGTGATIHQRGSHGSGLLGQGPESAGSSWDGGALLSPSGPVAGVGANSAAGPTPAQLADRLQRAESHILALANENQTLRGAGVAPQLQGQQAVASGGSPAAVAHGAAAAEEEQQEQVSQTADGEEDKGDSEMGADMEEVLQLAREGAVREERALVARRKETARKAEGSPLALRHCNPDGGPTYALHLGMPGRSLPQRGDQPSSMDSEAVSHGGHGSQPLPERNPDRVARAIKQLPPGQFTTVQASNSEQLEDYLFNVGRAIKSNLLERYEDRAELFEAKLDRSVYSWWQGACELAQEEGKPIDTFNKLAEAVRNNYTPVADEEQAMTLLLRVEQAAGESMEVYLTRAQGLRQRVSKTRVPDTIAGEVLLKGMSEARFPWTCMTLKREQQEQRSKTGQGHGFTQLRAKLAAMAAIEPGRSKAAAAPSTQPQPQQQQLQQGRGRRAGANGNGGGGRGTGAHINTLALQQTEQQEESDPGEEAGAEQGARTHVNAMSQGPARKCYKCGELGHIAADCTSNKPDSRVCMICNEKGHISPDCPTLNSKQKASIKAFNAKKKAAYLARRSGNGGAR